MSSEGKEGEDEAMQRYKASLLGAAAAGGGVSDDPRRVVITKLELIINGRNAPLSYDMTKPENLNGGLSVQLKEGCEYKTQLHFRVQNELVTGLQYKNNVAGGTSGISLLKVKEMLGSYGLDPKKENAIVFPRREWEEGAPRPTAVEGTTRLAPPRRPCALLPTPDRRVRASVASPVRHDGEGQVQVHDLLRRRRQHDAPRVQVHAGHRQGLGRGRRRGALVRVGWSRRGADAFLLFQS
jgi:hypothetical protein